MKQDHLRLRENYLIELQNKARATKLRNERVKQRWRILKKHFGKYQLHSISRVIYQHKGVAVIALNQIQVEKTKMNESSKQFILAYTSPLLKKEVLQKIGLQGEKASASELIKSGVQIPETTSMEYSFL